MRGPPGPVLTDPPVLDARVGIQLAQIGEADVDQGLTGCRGRRGSRSEARRRRMSRLIVLREQTYRYE